MPTFGARSLKQLQTCDPKIQEVLNEAIKHYDFSILEGHRTEEKQKEYFESGASKVSFPYSKHNSFPSLAVDIVPYPIDWDDRERFHLFAGFVLGIAQSMEINIRWGGDWNKNFEVDDNNFDDFPHFEIVKDF